MVLAHFQGISGCASAAPAAELGALSMTTSVAASFRRTGLLRSFHAASSLELGHGFAAGMLHD